MMENRNNEEIKKKVVRLIGGTAFAIVFLIFAIISISVAPHTSDLENYHTYTNYHRGVEREKADSSQSQAQAVSYSQSVSDLSASQTSEQESASSDSAEQSEEALRPEVEKARALGLPDPPEIDVSAWQYVLVNSDHLIEQDEGPEQIVYINMTADDTEKQTDYNGNRLPVDSLIADALLQMAIDCKAAGNPVYLSSGYRSYNEQSTLLQNKISSGYDYATAITIVAEPGSSEHQTGLCCDITDYYRQLKDSSLAETETYKWLAAHCTDYGFIVRYPADKSGSADSVTGIIYEPWHFRYVGTEAAKYITENNLCLEEFLELYE